MSKRTRFLYHFIKRERIQQLIVINVESVHVSIVGLAPGTDVFFY